MTRLALIPLGMQRGIRHSHTMNKAELITCLEKNDADPSFVLDKDIQATCYGYLTTWRRKNREQYNKYHRELRTNKKVRKQPQQITLTDDETGEEHLFIYFILIYIYI